MSFLKELREEQREAKHRKEQKQSESVKLAIVQSVPAVIDQPVADTQADDIQRKQVKPCTPEESGMIQCKHCHYWNYSRCRHTKYGSADSERWRRCKGYILRKYEENSE